MVVFNRQFYSFTAAIKAATLARLKEAESDRKTRLE